MHKVNRPELFPGKTILGRTSGPVVHVGQIEPIIPGVSAGIAVYLDERELREAVHAFDKTWLFPEQVQELRDTHERELAERDKTIAELEQRLADEGAQFNELAARIVDATAPVIAERLAGEFATSSTERVS